MDQASKIIRRMKENKETEWPEQLLAQKILLESGKNGSNYF